MEKLPSKRTPAPPYPNRGWSSMDGTCHRTSLPPSYSTSYCTCMATPKFGVIFGRAALPTTAIRGVWRIQPSLPRSFTEGSESPPKRAIIQMTASSHPSRVSSFKSPALVHHQQSRSLSYPMQHTFLSTNSCLMGSYDLEFRTNAYKPTGASSG